MDAAEQAVKLMRDQAEVAAAALEEATQKAYAQLQHHATFSEADLPDLKGAVLAKEESNNAEKPPQPETGK